MEAEIRDGDVPEQQSSFGIKKVVDCKIVEGGQQMYKVEWEATWEPAESLVSCQHLVDEFWSFVNKAKTNEEVAQQHIKRMKLQQSRNNLTNISQKFNMSADNKAEVQTLIAHANLTSAGSPILRSPSSMLMTSSQHTNNLTGGIQTLTHTNNQNLTNNSPQTPQSMTNPVMQPRTVQKPLDFSLLEQQQNLMDVGSDQQNTISGQKDNFNAFRNKRKVEADNSTEHSDGKGTGMASLKYLENFSNPYVKIIIVCKICNKEQSVKFAHNWRQHYLTHADKKPHKCSHCSKSFIRADQLRKHVQSKHGNAMSTVNSLHMNMVEPKQEQVMTPEVKREGYLF